MMTQHKWMIFTALSLAIMMVDLDITAVNLALATIAKELSISLSTAEWIIDGYITAAAALMAVAGRLSDHFGFRRVFLFGLTLFTCTSLAVGLSIGPWTILISRILQGACIAFTFPIAMVIVRFVFPQKEQGFAIGLLLAVAGFSQALGPTVGGVIIHLLGWRSIFFLDVPIALLALLISYYTIPNPTLSARRESIPVGSAALLMVSLLAIMTALNEVDVWGVTSTAFIGLFCSGFILLIMFISFELKTSKPLLDLQLLFNQNFLLINTVRSLLNFIYFGLLLVLGLFLQNILNYSPLHAGYILLALTLTFGLLSIPAGKLIDKIGTHTPILMGFMLLAIGNLVFALLTESPSLYTVLVALFIQGVAIALLIPATGTTALQTVPKEKSGAGMGVFLTNAFIGGGVGVAITGWLLSSYSRYHFHASLNLLSTPLTDYQEKLLTQAANGITPIPEPSQLISSELLQQITPFIHHAFMSGFSTIMWLFVGASLFSFLLSMKLEQRN